MRYYLLNGLTLHGNALSAGALLDDKVDNIPQLKAAGAFLVPATDSRLDAVAGTINKRRRGGGVNETEASLLMMAALLVSLTAADLANDTDAVRDTWYINPVAGDDGNDGKTIATAIKTDGELRNRVRGTELRPASGTLNINYLSAPPTTDRFNLSDIVLGVDVQVLVNGPTPTRVRTGTLTAVAALDRTSGSTAGGAPLKLTDTGVTTWEVGSRITLLTGAHAGKRAWIARDLGSGVCEIGGNFGSKLAGVTITVGTPSVGDTYAVETCATITLAEMNVRTAGRTGSFVSGILFSDLWCVGGGSADTISITGDTAHLVVSFDGCRLDLRIDCAMAVNIFNSYSSAGEWGRRAQLAYYQGGVLLSSFMIQRAGCMLALDQDVYVNGAITIGTGAALFIGTAGFFHCAGDVITLQVGSTCNVGNSGSWFLTGEGLYGNANVGYGLKLQAGCKFFYVTPAALTLVGTAGQWKLPTAAPAYFDAAARTFPTATAGTPNTWANLAAAQPGGFATGNAHDPDADAHILKVA